MNLSCFKAYDIRGKVPEVLNEQLAYDIGRAYASEFNPKTVVLGWDARSHSEMLSDAIAKGFTDSGVEVWDLGLCGTEEIYFATSHYGVDGGIMITASHNPKEDNGLKMVTAGSKPIGRESGLDAIKQRIIEQNFVEKAATPASRIQKTDKTAYIEHLLTYINLDSLKPLKIVVNGGNGAVGPTFKQLAEKLPFEFIELNLTPDGSFPNGVPNPMIPEKRQQTIDAVIEHQADFAVAWDGDFDRCFLFDEHGAFIEGYYLIGLLAQTLLKQKGAGKIVYEPRMTWNTIEQVEASEGEAVCARTGHVFIKAKMREVDAIYGGEMSAHHYFRDFFYCDSGMIPWLLIAQLLSDQPESLSQLVAERIAKFPCSGEINYTVENSQQIMEEVERDFTEGSEVIHHNDGLTIEYADWRFNIRRSGTEPLLRLNVESRGDADLVQEKVKALEAYIHRIG